MTCRHYGLDVESCLLLCRQVKSPNEMTTATVVKRILANRQAYEDRNAKKVKSEAAYYTQKAYMTEG